MLRHVEGLPSVLYNRYMPPAMPTFPVCPPSALEHAIPFSVTPAGQISDASSPKCVVADSVPVITFDGWMVEPPVLGARIGNVDEFLSLIPSAEILPTPIAHEEHRAAFRSSVFSPLPFTVKLQNTSFKEDYSIISRLTAQFATLCVEDLDQLEDSSHEDGDISELTERFSSLSVEDTSDSELTTLEELLEKTQSTTGAQQSHITTAVDRAVQMKMERLMAKVAAEIEFDYDETNIVFQPSPSQDDIVLEEKDLDFEEFCVGIRETSELKGKAIPVNDTLKPRDDSPSPAQSADSTSESGQHERPRFAGSRLLSNALGKLSQGRSSIPDPASAPSPAHIAVPLAGQSCHGPPVTGRKLRYSHNRRPRRGVQII